MLTAALLGILQRDKETADFENGRHSVLQNARDPRCSVLRSWALSRNTKKLNFENGRHPVLQHAYDRKCWPCGPGYSTRGFPRPGARKHRKAHGFPYVHARKHRKTRAFPYVASAKPRKTRAFREKIAPERGFWEGHLAKSARFINFSRVKSRWPMAVFKKKQAELP